MTRTSPFSSPRGNTPRFSEIALLHHALTLLAPFATDDGSGGEFHGPSLEDFFPPVIFFEGTVFEINRVILIRFFVVAVLLLLFWLGTRRMKVIPGRGQSVLEFAYGFVRDNIVYGALGEKDGKRFLPLLVTMFFFIVGMNLTGIIPGINLAGSSVFGLPIVLAIVSYVAFMYAGIKKHPGAFFKNSLFPSGVPWPLYFIITPIEFLSTFILRPVTLSIRLLMNMVAGHMLLVLCFSATQFFFFSTDLPFTLFGAGTLAFGFIFTIFELLVAVLQAYVFTYLTAVYIQLALAEEH
ncbi:F-type H+-transporting ATPase subunit a [Microbacteriaceae bacterium SG_E_30_P1]|uniref:ATP synthase subunit a n=1 Tax=Antiquaquibacter oligotrophicus TaxID=2880260 RepID=A0ABT6KN96_9MICO|nr:F-type H+-transporting ATPase subunit a [Antiquaquibacter oligotrophicus]